MAQPVQFMCEVDDCFAPAVAFVRGRLLCSQHALPYIRKPEQLKTVEPAQAEWLRPDIVEAPTAN